LVIFITWWQADQSGTIAEILIEDSKPVSLETVFSLYICDTHMHVCLETTCFIALTDILCFSCSPFL